MSLYFSTGEWNVQMSKSLLANNITLDESAIVFLYFTTLLLWIYSWYYMKAVIGNA